MRAAKMTCLLIPGILLFSPAGGEPTKAADVPSLCEVVLFGVRPLADLDPGRYPERGRSCVQVYLAAVPPECRAVLDSGPAGQFEALAARRGKLLAQQIALLGKQARQEAERFSAAIPLQLEWEGMSEGPLEEANFAGQWLEKYPGTAIAPFLHLFAAHRLRAGYEAARAGHEKGLWPILGKRYHEALQRALSSPSALIACIAADLEAQPYVYMEGQGRP